MGTELATQAQSFSLPDLQVMAKNVAMSRLFGGVDNEQSAFTLMLLCQAEGLHPIQAMRRYHIIEGKPSMRADAMQAEFQRNGGSVRWIKSSAEECVAGFRHPTQAPEEVEIGIEMQELIDRGVATTWNEKQGKMITKSIYKKFPAQMLRARVISEGVRMILPGVVVGIYTPEEIESDIIDVTPRDNPQVTVVETRTELPSSRQAVNEAFKPAAVENQTKAAETKRSSGELTPLEGDEINAKGLDKRKWTDVITGETKIAYAEVETYRYDLGLQPEIKESFNVHSVANHMVKAAIEAGYRDPYTYDDKGQKKKAGPGLVGSYLEEVYRKTDEWREWARVELKDYLTKKVKEGRSIAENEAHGDQPGPDENTSQEAEPAGANWAAGRQ